MSACGRASSFSRASIGSRDRGSRQRDKGGDGENAEVSYRAPQSSAGRSRAEYSTITRRVFDRIECTLSSRAAPATVARIASPRTAAKRLSDWVSAWGGGHRQAAGFVQARRLDQPPDRIGEIRRGSRARQYAREPIVDLECGQPANRRRDDRQAGAIGGSDDTGLTCFQIGQGDRVGLRQNAADFIRRDPAVLGLSVQVASVSLGGGIDLRRARSR